MLVWRKGKLKNCLCVNSIVFYYNGAQRYEQFLQVGRLYWALIFIIIIIYLLKKTTYSNRKASEQDRQAQGALTSALMVQVQ